MAGLDQRQRSREHIKRMDTPIGWSENVCPERRLVVLGRTGSGKSTTCNNILGRDEFKSDTCGQSVTDKCQRAICQRFGRNVEIIDTPGLFDTGMSNADITREVVKCIGMTAPGPHAFVMVLRIDRFTKEEQDTVEHFKNVFGKGMMKYLMILFTRKDDLDYCGKTIEIFAQISHYLENNNIYSTIKVMDHHDGLHSDDTLQSFDINATRDRNVDIYNDGVEWGQTHPPRCASVARNRAHDSTFAELFTLE